MFKAATRHEPVLMDHQTRAKFRPETQGKVGGTNHHEAFDSLSEKHRLFQADKDGSSENDGHYSK